MTNPCFDPVDIEEMERVVNDTSDDVDILDKMELGVFSRSQLIAPSGPTELRIREQMAGLPLVVREAAINTYRSFVSLRDHYADAYDILESEIEAYNLSRAAFRRMEVKPYRSLPPRYRNNFSRSRRFWNQRAQRYKKRMDRLKAKIDFLNKNIVEKDDSLPPCASICDLCNLAGDKTLTWPKQQALCSNAQCKFITCLPCFAELKSKTLPGITPLCPACRSKYVMKNTTMVARKEEYNPFDVISDDEGPSDSEAESLPSTSSSSDEEI